MLEEGGYRRGNRGGVGAGVRRGACVYVCLLVCVWGGESVRMYVRIIPCSTEGRCAQQRAGLSVYRDPPHRAPSTTKYSLRELTTKPSMCSSQGPRQGAPGGGGGRGLGVRWGGGG